MSDADHPNTPAPTPATATVAGRPRPVSKRRLADLETISGEPPVEEWRKICKGDPQLIEHRAAAWHAQAKRIRAAIESEPSTAEEEQL